MFGDSPDHGDADSIADNDNDNLTIHPADEFIQVISNNLTLHPAEEIFEGAGKPLNTLVPTGISKITKLTLDQFDNNYKLFAQKLADVDTDLVIRAILLKTMMLYLITAIKFTVQIMYKMPQSQLPIKYATYF